MVGLARAGSAADVARDAVDAVALRRHSLVRGVWETPAPLVWPPPLTYGEVRSASLEELPGCRVERVPYRRYGIVWTRPAA